MLLPDVIWDWGVGGDRMDMSSAVPRRNGTSGVSSRATKGRSPRTSSFWLVVVDARSELRSASTAELDAAGILASE